MDLTRAAAALVTAAGESTALTSGEETALTHADADARILAAARDILKAWRWSMREFPGGPPVLPLRALAEAIDARDALDQATPGEAPLTHNEGTLRKVYDALSRAGLTETQCIDAINDMQNNGLCFREAAPAPGEWVADHQPKPPVTLYLTDPRDTLKMIRETLCIAQTRIGNSEIDAHRIASDIACLGRIIAEIDRQRPLGQDGKHRDLHTPTCGCEDVCGGEGQEASQCTCEDPDCPDCHRCPPPHCCDWCCAKSHTHNPGAGGEGLEAGV